MPPPITQFLDGTSQTWSPEGILGLAESLNDYHTIYLTNVKGSVLAPLFVRLSTNTTLVSLRLDGCKLHEDDLELLSIALKTNSTLSILSLDNCGLHDHGIQTLSQNLDANFSIKKLFLYNNEIGDGGTRALAKWIAKNKTLEVLDLSENNIGDAGMDALAKVIRYNKALEVLIVNNNLFGPAGLNAFTNALCSNTTLRAYYASHNAFSDASVIRLARTSSSLQSLSLASTGIGDDAVMAFLESPMQLKHLDLSNNKITDRGGMQLQACSTTTFFVQGNPMSDQLIWYAERETDV